MNSLHTLRMLHKFKARDLAQFLDLFDKDIEDDMGDSIGVIKTDDVFYERIVGLLPMFVPKMDNK